MASTMKFNKKVYVIPEDKYNSMVRNRELRDGEEAERGSVRLHRHPAHSSEAQDETRSTLSSVADEMSGGPKTHSPESDRALQDDDMKTVNDKSGKPRPGDSTASADSGDSGDSRGTNATSNPDHVENASHEKPKGGKGHKHGDGREAEKAQTVSPRTAQEDMVRRTLFTLLKPQKRSNLMKVYAGLFSNNNNKGPGSQKTPRPEKALTIPGLPSRDLFLALLHTQCERSARPDNYKPLYSRLLLNKVPLTYIGNKRLRRVLHYLKNRHSHRMGSVGGVGGVGGVRGSHTNTPSKMVKTSKLKDSNKLQNAKGREKPHAQKIRNVGQRSQTMQSSKRSRRDFKDPWIRI